MAAPLWIMSWNFDDEDWLPTDRWEFEFWMTVTVGDGRAGSCFQIHISAPASIRTFRDKRALFVLDEWKSEDDLIEQLDAFIAREHAKDPHTDLYERLSRHWLWEYAGMTPS